MSRWSTIPTLLEKPGPWIGSHAVITSRWRRGDPERCARPWIATRTASARNDDGAILVAAPLLALAPTQSAETEQSSAEQRERLAQVS